MPAVTADSTYSDDHDKGEIEEVNLVARQSSKCAFFKTRFMPAVSIPLLAQMLPIKDWGEVLPHQKK